MESLILVVNPGSASRKYSLYNKSVRVADAHFELNGERIECTYTNQRSSKNLEIKASNVADTLPEFLALVKAAKIINDQRGIGSIGVRIVAPSSFFLSDHFITESVFHELKKEIARAPLHLSVVCAEIERLKKDFPGTPIVGVSDSAFHITKPDMFWNYGIDLELADTYQIKRFGYHGISAASVVKSLKRKKMLRPKTVICHLGSGCSVTAVQDGKSLDNTMGFSPLEGLLMATRSGSIDYGAAAHIKRLLQLDDISMMRFLNSRSGLLGISGVSSDVRTLLEYEKQGHYRAGLALRMFVLHIQQAIGQMAAAMNGVDMLIFTGTVGERSFMIRRRIAENLSFLGLAVDDAKNNNLSDAPRPVTISRATSKKPIYVMHTDESSEIARRVHALINGEDEA